MSSSRQALALPARAAARTAALVAGLALAASAQAGLVASYSFEEAAGAGSAAPTVGTVSGSLNSAASFAPGAGVNGSGALRLARGGLVDYGDNFGFASAYTVAIWVQLAAGEANVQVPFGKHIAGAGIGYYISIGESVKGKAQLYPGGSNFVTGDTLVNDGQWHQLIGTFDAASGVAALYLDGQLEKSLTGAATLTNTTSFLLGGTTNGPTYNGLLDELRIYDTALSAAEARALYSSTVNPGPHPAPEPASGGLLVLALLAAARFSGRGLSGRHLADPRGH